jgi:hypothetical protein
MWPSVGPLLSSLLSRILRKFADSGKKHFRWKRAAVLAPCQTAFSTFSDQLLKSANLRKIHILSCLQIRDERVFLLYVRDDDEHDCLQKRQLMRQKAMLHRFI